MSSTAFQHLWCVCERGVHFQLWARNVVQMLLFPNKGIVPSCKDSVPFSSGIVAFFWPSFPPPGFCSRHARLMILSHFLCANKYELPFTLGSTNDFRLNLVLTYS